MSLKILLSGAKGRMGQAIIAASASESDCEIVSAIDLGDNAKDHIQSCDVVIDFSFRDATAPLAELCAQYNKGLVIGTTGHSKEQRDSIFESAKKIPIVWAGNYSVGVNLLNYLTKIASKVLDEQYDIEVVEMHHKHKKDAPSGTAEKLIKICQESRNIPDENLKFGREGLVGERTKDEIGVHSLRGGSVVGDHTVIFASDGERLELTHKASDRQIFACGALRAARFVAGKSPTIYGMEDVLGLK